MSEHTVNTHSFRHRSGTPELTGYRRQMAAFARRSPGNKGKLAGLLSRQLLNLERDPDNTALRELALQTIRRLAVTD